MKMIARLAVRVYVVLVLFVGFALLFFALRAFPLEGIINSLYNAYTNLQIRLTIGAIAVAIMFINYLLARAIVGDDPRGKTIAFDNPSGRVSVSLTAMEDLARRIIVRESEVKEVRVSIRAGKKGLEVSSRLTLNIDVNIPEMTSRVQELVKRKIQDTIGLEEAVVVRVDVDKIIPEASRKVKTKAKSKQEVEEPSEPTLPFQGYRA